MKKDLWQRAEELFHNALEHSPETRRAFLDEACGEDAELRRQVETLLSQDEQAGSFLEKPALADAAVTLRARGSLVGRQFGQYRILSSLGAGGMGEVYRAYDGKLGREIAFKTLTPHFSGDQERIARFQREAKLLASLNHPNIAAIYGLEESGGTNFLVLELVEGGTLADRMQLAPIPVEESLRLALQIAEALEAAHEKGVIHRDLKPANIKVTPDGKVKVLDFGLAKAFAGEQAELNPSNSPTLSDMATQQGVILGTAAYMSPEQAKGKTVDKRADIWSFGAVLFEMLTGQAAFQGEDITEILASVVKGGANLDLLPANLHPRVREVIIRCLQKDLKKRYHDIADVRYEIEQSLADPGGVLVQPAVAAEPRAKSRTLLWVAAAVVVTAIIAGIAAWELKPTESRQVVRFDYDLPEGQQFSNISNRVLAISQDGKEFVYSTTKGLYLRFLEELTARLIPGTEGNTRQPFFSPDGKSIGYFSPDDKKLKKIAFNGGTAVPLCEITTSFLGASWGVDNTIVYSEYLKGIMQIPANGGTPESVIKTPIGLPVSPQILPDGKWVLYAASFGQDNAQTQMKIIIQSVKSGESRELFAGISARYLATGHIVYQLANNNNLFAVPFDLERKAVAGGRVPIVEEVGAGGYAVSESGTLVYLPPRASSVASQFGRTLVWVDREGNEKALSAPPNYYQTPKISPDGSQAALAIITDGTPQIYVLDLSLGNMKQLTFEKQASFRPIWIDGKRIAFASNKDGIHGIYWKAVDGTGEVQKLCSAQDLYMKPYSCSRDGKTLAIEESDYSLTRYDISILSLETDHARRPLLHEENIEGQPNISPDGKYIAYMSMEKPGGSEICVRPFPEVSNGKWKIQARNAAFPMWSADGRELFYSINNTVMAAVSVDTTSAFSAETPRKLFQTVYGLADAAGPNWDVSPDGKRFLMIKQPFATDSAATTGPRTINIILNWTEELKQRVPVK
jgi:eukaryotic-like serine/threonine-protein kinase